MIRISVPATSANIGPGFDVLGIAFDLYNSFKFEKSERFTMINFENRYSNPKYNLVCNSYKKVFDYLNLEYIYVNIYMDTQDIPTSRGLGSSATCIVAGVLAAKYFLGDKISYDECFQIASKIEGHPDNIAPAMFGSMIASYNIDGVYKYVKYDVSNELKFNILVPNFELSTHDSRGVLPNELSYKDIIFNTSRIVNIPYAFKSGDLDLIKELLFDKMHEPYRMKLIKNASLLRDIAHENGCSFSISGAGPSLLVISKDNINDLFKSFKDFNIYNLNIASNGALVEEIGE